MSGRSQSGRSRGSRRDSKRESKRSTQRTSLRVGVAEEVFSVFPQVVGFENVESGTAYYVYIKVQNQTSRQQNIRVLPPVSPHFTLQVEGGT